METPGGEGSAKTTMQPGNTLKSLSRTPRPAGLPKPGKSDTQKTTAAPKASKHDVNQTSRIVETNKATRSGTAALNFLHDQLVFPITFPFCIFVVG